MRKNVPNLVYMQNQKVLSCYIHMKLEDKVYDKELASLQYQTNLYLNALWEEVCSEETGHASASSILSTLVNHKKAQSVISEEAGSFMVCDMHQSNRLSKNQLTMDLTTFLWEEYH